MTELEALVDKISLIVEQKQQIEKKEAAVRAQIMKLMQSQGIENIETGSINITYVQSFTKRLIDREKLKKLFPDVEKQCSKMVPVDASIKIRFGG